MQLSAVKDDRNDLEIIKFYNNKFGRASFKYEGGPTPVLQSSQSKYMTFDPQKMQLTVSFSNYKEAARYTGKNDIEIVIIDK